MRATNAQFDSPEILRRLDVRLLEVSRVSVWSVLVGVNMLVKAGLLWALLDTGALTPLHP